MTPSTVEKEQITYSEEQAKTTFMETKALTISLVMLGKTPFGEVKGQTTSSQAQAGTLSSGEMGATRSSHKTEVMFSGEVIVILPTRTRMLQLKCSPSLAQARMPRTTQLSWTSGMKQRCPTMKSACTTQSSRVIQAMRHTEE